MKKFAALILIASLLLSMTGCGYIVSDSEKELFNDVMQLLESELPQSMKLTAESDSYSLGISIKCGICSSSDNALLQQEKSNVSYLFNEYGKKIYDKIRPKINKSFGIDINYYSQKKEHNEMLLHWSIIFPSNNEKKEYSNPHHAAIISDITNNEIYYAAHTDEKYDAKVSTFLNKYEDGKVYIIRLKDLIITS